MIGDALLFCVGFAAGWILAGIARYQVLADANARREDSQFVAHMRLHRLAAIEEKYPESELIESDCPGERCPFAWDREDVK